MTSNAENQATMSSKPCTLDEDRQWLQCAIRGLRIRTDRVARRITVSEDLSTLRDRLKNLRQQNVKLHESLDKERTRLKNAQKTALDKNASSTSKTIENNAKDGNKPTASSSAKLPTLTPSVPPKLPLTNNSSDASITTWQFIFNDDVDEPQSDTASPTRLINNDNNKVRNSDPGGGRSTKSVTNSSSIVASTSNMTETTTVKSENKHRTSFYPPATNTLVNKRNVTGGGIHLRKTTSDVVIKIPPTTSETETLLGGYVDETINDPSMSMDIPIGNDLSSTFRDVGECSAMRSATIAPDSGQPNQASTSSSSFVSASDQFILDKTIQKPSTSNATPIQTILQSVVVAPAFISEPFTSLRRLRPPVELIGTPAINSTPAGLNTVSTSNGAHELEQGNVSSFALPSTSSEFSVAAHRNASAILDGSNSLNEDFSTALNSNTFSKDASTDKSIAHNVAGISTTALSTCDSSKTDGKNPSTKNSLSTISLD